MANARKATPAIGGVAGPSEVERFEELVEHGGRWVLRRGAAAPAATAPLVPALDKAIRVLAYINRNGNRETSLAEIADATDISRSHCHAILKTLAHHDWLLFNDATRTYRLHAGILRDLSGLLQERSQVTLIKPVLERLCQSTGVSCILSEPLPDGSFIVVDKVSAPRAMEISYPIGHRFPRDAAAQMRANLAWRTRDEIEAFFRAWRPRAYSSHTITAPSAVRRELEETRRRGYARSVGEFTDGLMALALPVFGPTGKVLFVLDCMSLIPVLLPQEERVVAAMQQAVAEVHAMFGSAPPEPHAPRAPAAD